METCRSTMCEKQKQPAPLTPQNSWVHAKKSKTFQLPISNQAKTVLDKVIGDQWYQLSEY